MHATQDSFKTNLYQLKQHYLQRLPTKLLEIEENFRRLKASDHDDIEWQEFLRSVHNLVGSAGCYGLTRVSQKAYELELFLLSENKPMSRDFAAYLDRLWCFIFSLKNLAREPATTATATDVSAASPETAALLTNLRILIASDDSDTRGYLSGICDETCASVSVVDNGQQVLECYDSESTDTLLMDVNMPELSGFDVARQIRSLNRNRFVPIILMSAIETDTMVAKSIASGADAFLAKPISQSRLFSQLVALNRLRERLEAVGGRD